MCGWNGIPDHNFLRDDHGDVALILSAKKCPRCGQRVTELKPPPPVPIQLVQAVRDAKLTPDELLSIADAVRDAPPGLSPRALAERVPSASKLITVASKLGESWAELLVIAVTLIGTYVMHQDSERAHRDAVRARPDAEQAHQDAERAHRDAVRVDSGALEDADVQRLADKLTEEFRRTRPGGSR